VADRASPADPLGRQAAGQRALAPGVAQVAEEHFEGHRRDA
jgi:hypothetical protein